MYEYACVFSWLHSLYNVFVAGFDNARVSELNYLINRPTTFRYGIACNLIQLLIKLLGGSGFSDGLSIHNGSYSAEYIILMAN